MCDATPTPHAADSRPRILEWLELQALGGKPDGAAIIEQSLAIDGDEVRHWPAFPQVPMKPEPALHRVDHPGATVREFPVARLGRGMRISSNVGPRGVSHAARDRLLTGDLRL